MTEAQSTSGKWMPIETAPKDGTRVLIWSPMYGGGRAVGARWDDDRYANRPRGFWNTDTSRTDGLAELRKNPPQWWQPLPTPPQTEGEKTP